MSLSSTAILPFQGWTTAISIPVERGVDSIGLTFPPFILGLFYPVSRSSGFSNRHPSPSFKPDSIFCPLVLGCLLWECRFLRFYCPLPPLISAPTHLSASGSSSISAPSPPSDAFPKDIFPPDGVVLFRSVVPPTSPGSASDQWSIFFLVGSTLPLGTAASFNYPWTRPSFHNSSIPSFF